MSGFLTAAAVMLGAAVLFVILFRRLGLGATLGYIVSGAILGPYVLNLVGEAETIQSVAEIGIGVKEFKCIGESPPQDHPHVYINMGETNTIPCPYCGTRFRFDPRLTPLDADPPDSVFTEHNAA